MSSTDKSILLKYNLSYKMPTVSIGIKHTYDTHYEDTKFELDSGSSFVSLSNNDLNIITNRNYDTINYVKGSSGFTKTSSRETVAVQVIILPEIILDNQIKLKNVKALISENREGDGLYSLLGLNVLNLFTRQETEFSKSLRLRVGQTMKLLLTEYKDEISELNYDKVVKYLEANIMTYERDYAILTGAKYGLDFTKHQDFDIEKECQSDFLKLNIGKLGDAILSITKQGDIYETDIQEDIKYKYPKIIEAILKEKGLFVRCIINTQDSTYEFVEIFKS